MYHSALLKELVVLNFPPKLIHKFTKNYNQGQLYLFMAAVEITEPLATSSCYYLFNILNTKACI